MRFYIWNIFIFRFHNDWKCSSVYMLVCADQTITAATTKIDQSVKVNSFVYLEIKAFRFHP